MKWIWGIFLLVLAYSGLAQPSPYNIRNFDGSYNLPHKSIQALAVDGQGFTWIGTSEGLYRFDGNEAKRFVHIPSELRNASVTALLIDAKDRLWMGTFGEGLIMIDLKDESHKVFNISTFKEDNIAHNRIKALLEDQSGNIWIGTQISGIQKLRSDFSGFDHYLPSESFPDRVVREIDDVISMYYTESEPNMIWMSTLGGVLSFNISSENFDAFIFDKKSCETPEHFNGLENVVRRLVVTSECIYAGTWGGGFCTMQRDTRKWKAYKFNDNRPASRSYNSVFVFDFPFKENTLLVSDFEMGTFEYDLTTDAFTPLLDAAARFTTTDDGRLWIGTWNSKLSLLDPRPKNLMTTSLPFSVTSFFHDEKRDRFIFNFLKDDGYYESSYEGQIRSRTSIPSVPEKDYKQLTRTMIPYENGYLNISSPGFLYYDTLSQRVLTNEQLLGVSLPQFPTMSLTVDSLRNIWFAGKYAGLVKCRVKEKEVEIITTSNGGTHDDWVYIMMTDKNGNVWYGTDRGFGVYHAARDTFIGYDGPKANRDSNNYHGIVIDGMVDAVDEKIYIAGEKGGIIAIDYASVNDFSLQAEWVLSPNERGIEYDLLVEDQEKNLWQLGRNTLLRYDPELEQQFEYALPDRLLRNWNLFPMASSGVAVGGVNGFHMCVPNDTFEHAQNFKLLFTDIYILGERKYSSYDLTDQNNIELSAQENYFTINASLLGLTDPDYVEYEYRMTGLKDEWTPSVTGKTFSWTNLREGRYQFQLRALVEGNYIESEVLNIHIAPPFYRTSIFRILLLLLLALLSYGFYRYRMRRAEQQARHQVQLAEMEMKTLRSQMNPHFIFNCLNSIRLAVFEEDFDLASRYITNFSKLLRTILQNVKSHYISLDKELEAMTLYMNLEKMRFRDKFDYSVYVDSAIEPSMVKIPPLIIQPFIENAIWHGIMPKEDLGHINIRVVPADSGFKCQVQDNGIGREKAKAKKQHNKQQSFGIQITQERLEILNRTYGINATIKIEDLYENGEAMGTLVTIHIPEAEEA